MIGHALPILSLVRVLKNLNELNFGLNAPGEVFSRVSAKRTAPDGS